METEADIPGLFSLFFSIIVPLGIAQIVIGAQVDRVLQKRVRISRIGVFWLADRANWPFIRQLGKQRAWLFAWVAVGALVLVLFLTFVGAILTLHYR